MWQRFPSGYLSSFRHETAPYSSEDLICPESDDGEGSEEGGARKRRRIVEAGMQYLEGRGHFIQTARLRGPFSKRWKNPWAKRKVACSPLGRHRDPEGLDHCYHGRTSKEPKTAVKHDVTKQYLMDREAFRAESSLGPHARVRAGGEPTPIAPKRSLPSYEAAFTMQPPLERAWLKKSNVQNGQNRSREQRSPTPSPAPKLSKFTNFTTLPEHNSRGNGLAIEESLPSALLYGEVQDAKLIEIDDSPQRDLFAEARDTLSYGLISMPQRRDRLRDISLSRHNIFRHACAKPRRLSSHAAVTRECPYTTSADKGPLLTEDKEAILLVTTILHSGRSTFLKTISEGSVKHPTWHLQDLSPEAASSKHLPRNPNQVYQREYQVHSKNDSPTAGIEDHVSMSSNSHSPFKDIETSASGLKLDQHNGDEVSFKATVSARKQLKRKARPFTARRLTFTPNGNPQLRPHPQLRKSRQVSSSHQDALPKKDEEARSEVITHKASATTTKTSSRSSERSKTSDNKSKESTGVLQEAQIIQDPLPPAQVVSDSSTNVLETDKLSTNQPVWDEEDSYADLATQAAMEKARRRFQDEVVAEMNIESPQKAKDNNKRTDESHIKSAERRMSERTPIANDFQPLSTQAMIDELSPFAITTIKKRSSALKRQTSFAKSPIAAKHDSPSASPNKPMSFPTFSPNMSTTPSTSPSPRKPQSSQANFNGRKPSATTPQSSPTPRPTQTSLTPYKPPLPSEYSKASSSAAPAPTTLSALPSFSVLPNGTLSESTFAQDGQQPQPQPQPPLAQEESYTTLPDIDFSKPLSGMSAWTSSKESKPDPKSFTNGSGSGGILASSVGKGENNKVPSEEKGEEFEAGLVEGMSVAMCEDEKIESAIEDAGSFLGDWNIDAEARREGATPKAVEQDRLWQGADVYVGGKRRSIYSERKRGR